jgi:putative resolvase
MFLSTCVAFNVVRRPLDRLTVALNATTNQSCSGRSVCVHPQTAYGWVCEDRMPAPFGRLASGTILVDVAKPSGDQPVVRCARGVQP